jgi:enoyl-CoA hydratase/carnithine racemase
MDQPLVLLTTNEGIAVLSLNHPEKRNALSHALLSELKDHLARIAKDKTIRVVILRANGPAFSSGHDLRELVGRNEQDYQLIFALCTEVMEAIRLLPQPVIAQVQGVATAAGCQLAASCDLVVAAEEATFATPGVKIGLFCTTPAVPLVRTIAPKHAMEMLLTGRPVSAQEAEKMGLVNRVVPASQLAEETLRLARQICTASTYTVSLGKQAFYDHLALYYPAAYEKAQQVMIENALARDAQEGIKSFLEKRPPRWDS